MDKQKGRIRAVLNIGAATAATLPVGYLDYLTGVELRVFPLYFIPVGYVAWTVHRSAGVGVSLIAIASWEVSNRLAGMRYTTALHEYWNVTVQWAALLVFALTLARLRLLVDRERAASRVDALTSVANGRAFFARLNDEAARARRYQQPITVAYLDLDNFKRINDQHGHHEGDRVLVTFAKVLLAQCRTTDCVARLGGDEFALILPETNASAANLMLTRLQERVRDEMQRAGWPVSTSIGAVTFQTIPRDTDEFVRQADALMYKVKSSGKNAVRVENSFEGETSVERSSDRIRA